MGILKSFPLYLLVGVVNLAALEAPAFAQMGGGTDEAIPPEFRGQIIYDGAYEGTMSTPPKMPRNFNLGSMLNAAMNAKSEPYSGPVRYEVEYEGTQVKGVWKQQGSFTGQGTLTGTRTGSTCKLVTNEGLQYVAQCGLKEFSTRLSFTDNRGRKYKSIISANRTALVDYVERDKQRVIDAEKSRIAAAAAAARYAALPNAGPALTRKFDGLVQIDAQGWAFNRYSAGSMRNVKIVSGKAGVGTYVMRGEYTYNGGSVGTVMAEMNGPNLSCIQFWDGVVGCRGLRTAAQGQAMRSAFASALMGGGSGSGSSSRNDDFDIERGGSSSSPPPSPPPTSSGFYGNCHGGAAYGC